MDTDELKATIKRELPNWLREDPEFRAYVLELTRAEYADRVGTEDRFTRLLGELRRDREEQAAKWAEQNRKWEENQAELRRLREEEERRWAEYRAERDRKLEEETAKWAEQNRKWEENQA
ncbi:MAG: hypothetical protein R3202_09410, partial [Candidatus Competibacterales bacterium]|nr:hypothetical protein [Candidatus Competibacterales bacterium]